MLFYIELADVMSNRTVGKGNTTLPACTLLGRTLQGAAVEIKALRREVIRQVGSTLVENAPQRPQAQICQVSVLPQLAQVLEVRRHHHHDGVDGSLIRLIDTGGREPLRDREAGGEVSNSGLVIGLQRVAGIDHIPVTSGNALFKSHDARRRSGWVHQLECSKCSGEVSRAVVMRGEELQHSGNMLLIGGESVGVARLAVVGLIREAETRLQQVESIQIRAGILFHPVPERTTDTEAVEAAERQRQLMRVLGGGNHF